MAQTQGLRLDIWQLMELSERDSLCCGLCALPRQGDRTGLPWYWQRGRLRELLYALPDDSSAGGVCTERAPAGFMVWPSDVSCGVTLWCFGLF